MMAMLSSVTTGQSSAPISEAPTAPYVRLSSEIKNNICNNMNMKPDKSWIDIIAAYQFHSTLKLFQLCA